ncbi:CHAT domain-containing protein [Flavilitoribacter nigricans]|uniref:CHAT domain-containing protein n=1 Tax=Flavilitoribacter nigricans TaxID=70997 RepID=UPI00117B9CAF|nr:CHAT domain-containing protein [Flavilitoribacter nigricans]
MQYSKQVFSSSILRLVLCILAFTAVNPLAAQDDFEAEIATIKELDWPEQRERFEAAVESRKGTPLQRARYHHELGVVYFVLDDLFQAIEQTEKALEIRLDHEAEAGEEVLYSAYNLGSFYHNLGNFDEAFAYFQLIVDRAPNSRLGYTLFRLGSLYRDLGEFKLSEQAFAAALKEAPYPDDQAERTTLLAEWADLYLKQETPEATRSAIDLLEKAYANYDELAASDGYYASLAALSLNRLGLAYTNARDLRRARSYFQQALDYNEQCCQDEDLAASIHTNMGIAYRHLGQPSAALEWHRKALDIRLESVTPGKTDITLARTFDNLASTYLDLGRPREGLDHIQRALSWGLPQFKPSGAEDNPSLTLLREYPNKNSLLIHLQDKARLWTALAEKEQNADHLQQALATYRTCDQLIDLMRESHLEKNTKLYWREQAQKMYQSAVKVALMSERADAAFYFFEKSRAVLLLDGLRELNASSRLPAATRKQLARLAAKIQYLEKAAYEEAASGEPAPNDQLSLLREQYRHLLDSVEAGYPDYYRQKYRPGILGLQDLQDQLAPGEIWVEYFLANDFSLGFVVEKTGVNMVELAAPESLEPHINALLRNLKQYDAPFDPEPALALYRYLIEPLQLRAGSRLTIVPDARLSLIPFEVLLTDRPEGADYGQWDFLLRQHEVHYAFSASSHYFQTGNRPEANGKVLAFAPMAQLAPELGVDESLELPRTRFTTEYISKILPTDLFLGRDARRERLLEMAPRASVLHLATHAYLDHEQPEFSYFLVADPDPERRRFYVNELYQQQYSADLAVLSACETGAGKLFRGEGVASIGRAFAQNGCPNLAMSLWPVDEGATSRLLESFYEKLKAGSPKGAALHRAKLDYLEQFGDPQLKHPFRWSGFVYYGQDTPLELKAGGRSTWPYLLAIGLVVLGLISLRSRKKV